MTYVICNIYFKKLVIHKYLKGKCLKSEIRLCLLFIHDILLICLSTKYIIRYNSYKIPKYIFQLFKKYNLTVQFLYFRNDRTIKIVDSYNLIVKYIMVIYEGFKEHIDDVLNLIFIIVDNIDYCRE